MLDLRRIFVAQTSLPLVGRSASLLRDSAKASRVGGAVETLQKFFWNERSAMLHPPPGLLRACALRSPTSPPGGGRFLPPLSTRRAGRADRVFAGPNTRT